MADEIHPAHPLVPSTPLDNHTDEKRRKKPQKLPEKSSDETEEVPPKRPPRSGIIDEYV